MKKCTHPQKNIRWSNHLKDIPRLVIFLTKGINKFVYEFLTGTQMILHSFILFKTDFDHPFFMFFYILLKR